MPANNTDTEKRLWEAADQLRANSRLRASEYSTPVLGLIFLRFADLRFARVHEELLTTLTPNSRRAITSADYHARGVLYLPEEARYSTLLALPGNENLGIAINAAMGLIEVENPELQDVLPQSYRRFDNDLLLTLLKIFHSIPLDIEGDLFGKIYEYFLSKFAMAEGQRGGEFFTPTSLVKLIVEIIEPFHGRIFDPACGSGGMFVQSARFVQNHQRNPTTEVSVYGQEKTNETRRLCRMNLAVHGLSGDVRLGNSYLEDPHGSRGKFDFVMANPPFNVNGVDKDKLADPARFPFGLPRTDNANYLWIQIFYSALNEQGRAGFVMPNSASDARASELELRRQLLEAGAVDVMVAISSNFFYTVTLPCTLWFLDRGKRETPRRETVLFLDARHIYQQIDRAHRDFTPAQIEYLANIVRLYRGEELEFSQGSQELLQASFPSGTYTDVPGLCKVATLAEIAEQGYSLNPGRYVGIAERATEDFDFKEKLGGLNEELETLNAEARTLEERISENMGKLLEDEE